MRPRKRSAIPRAAGPLNAALTDDEGLVRGSARRALKRVRTRQR
ncbi:MAG: hypothetical protein ACP5C4_00030 [Methanomicrobiales archaeon]